MRIQQEADGFEFSNCDNQMLMLPQVITIAKKQNSIGSAVTPNTGGDSRQSTLSHQVEMEVDAEERPKTIL